MNLQQHIHLLRNGGFSVTGRMSFEYTTTRTAYSLSRIVLCYAKDLPTPVDNSSLHELLIRYRESSFATQRTYPLPWITVRYTNCLQIPYDLLCHCVIPCSRIPSRCFFAPYPLFPRNEYISSSTGCWSHNCSI